MPADTRRDTTPDRNNPRARAILLAAAEILSEEGLEGLTTRRVAERAGVNKGLVFYYWGSMTVLFEEVLEDYYARHKEVLAQAAAGPGDVRRRAHAMIDAYVTFMAHNHAYARIVQRQIAGVGAESSVGLEVARRHLSEVMETTRALLGDLTPAEGPLSARHFYLSLSGAVVNYFTYAPALGPEVWGGDALVEAEIAERREHLHWVVDCWFDGLETRRSAT